MSDIEITHTAADGTLVSGTSRNDGSAEILRAAGFRWFRSLGCWGVPQSRDRAAKLYPINRAADGLRAAGFDVTVTIDRTVRDAATVAEDRSQRLEDRRDALEAKADRRAEQAEERRAYSDRLVEHIPFGQPILVGHHSERGHRKTLERSRNAMFKYCELSAEAREAARMAESSRREQAYRETGPALQRRIERLQAELRGVEREMTPCRASGVRTKPEAEGQTVTCIVCYREVTISGQQYPEHGCATGEYREQMLETQERLIGDIEFCQQRLAAAVDGGYRIWGPADFKKGDYVVSSYGSFGTGEIVRVNPKTLSVKNRYTWTDKLPYDRVRGKVTAEEMAARQGSEATEAS